jgi:hypothetical protein
MDSNQDKTTAHEALLSETLGDVYILRKEIAAGVENAKQIRLEIAEAFSEMEKSISEMNTQIEESIKKHGDKSCATIREKLNLILSQMTAYQLDSLNKIQAFFDTKAKKLAPELDEEINAAKQKALKEIAVLVDRINGDKLVNKLVTYAIVFSISSSLITASLTYMIIINNVPSTQVETIKTQQTAKHR